MSCPESPKILLDWLDEQPEPKGQILAGEAGVILRHDPDTTVGIDVAYISAEVIVRQTEDSTLIDGVPTLVVEILSPSDTIEDINEKIDAYLAAKVAIIWIIDPYRRTVTVYQPDSEPELFNVRDELSAEPHLPGSGFRLRDSSSKGSIAHGCGRGYGTGKGKRWPRRVQVARAIRSSALRSGLADSPRCGEAGSRGDRRQLESWNPITDDNALKSGGGHELALDHRADLQRFGFSLLACQIHFTDPTS